MARIRPYESQVSPLGQVPTQQAQLSDVGGPGLEHVGQAITSAGAAGAHAYQILQVQEDAHATTNVHVSMAELANRATQELAKKKATADPSDPNFFNTVYRGGVAEGEEPAAGSIHDQLNKMREQVTNPVAQRRFETEAAALTHQVLVQATAFQGHLAGVHAKQQAKQLTDNLQAMVQTDPSQHTNAIALMTAAVNDPQGIFFRPGMDAGARESIMRDMTNEISSSTVYGMIGDSPQHALHSLEAGEWDNKITGEKKIVLARAAETAIHVMEVEKNRAQTEVLRQQKAKHDQTDQAFGAKFALSQANPGNAQFKPLTATEVGQALLHNEIDGSTGRAWLNMIEESTRRGPAAVHTNPTVERNLFKRIYLPDGDPRKIIDTQPIYDAYTNRMLSDTSMSRLRDELVKARSPEGSQFGKEKASFLKGIEPQITKPGPFGIYADPTTPEKFAAFERELEATIALYHKDGKDPRALFDPNSKDYFGKVAKSAKYQSVGFGSLEPPAPASVPGAPPRKSLDAIFGGIP